MKAKITITLTSEVGDLPCKNEEEIVDYIFSATLSDLLEMCKEEKTKRTIKFEIGGN